VGVTGCGISRYLMWAVEGGSGQFIPRGKERWFLSDSRADNHQSQSGLSNKDEATPCHV